MLYTYRWVSLFLWSRTRPQGVSRQKIGDYSWQCDCHIATQWCHREFNLILHNVTEILLATLGHPPLLAWLKPPLFTRLDQDCIKPKLKPLLPLWISCGLMLFFSMFCESCRQLVSSCQGDITSLSTMIFIICYSDPDHHIHTKLTVLLEINRTWTNGTMFCATVLTHPGQPKRRDPIHRTPFALWRPNNFPIIGLSSHRETLEL